MREPKIQFKCPKCGHDRLVQLRHYVQSRDVIDSFVVADSSSPGRKYNLLTSNSFNSEGKVVRFECECCGFFPTTGDGTSTYSRTGPSTGPRASPIVSIKHLFDWLKRQKMIVE